MRIHKEGFVSILIATLFVAAVLFAYFFFLPGIPVYVDIAFCLVAAAFLFFVIRFFRVPKRMINTVENGILAPADGKVVVIEETVENEYFKDKRIQISIFMSPLNVHVNSYPIDGTIERVAYHPGKFMVASLPKSSTENERNTVVVKKDEKQTVLFRQVAGAVARRIVCYSKEKQTVKQGEEMGIIKFGSRVDVFIPLTAQINVKIGDSVTSKKSVLAYF